MLSGLFSEMKQRQRSFKGALIFCLGLGGCAAQAGNVSGIEDAIVPHVAEYHFKMTHAEQGSSIVDASGVLGFFLGPGKGRQEHAGQDGNDGNDHQ